MKSWILRLYASLTQPLYARLNHDLSIQMQMTLTANLEQQEKFAAKILDELISTRLELEKATKPYSDPAPTVPDAVSEEEISLIVNQMTSHMRIVELACENGYAVKDLIMWRERYGGMSPKLIRKVRNLEKENERLKEALARMVLEKTVESEAGLYS